MVIKLGILSAARISNVIVSASKLVDEIEVVAISSRSPSKAERFAESHGIARTCTHDELIASADIDAIYIPLPTKIATEWAVQAAAAGKHVLVDKPFASVEAVEAISTEVKKAGTIFLDGTHWVHSARATKALEVFNKSCGEPHIVKSSFSAPLDLTGDIRTDTSLEPHGALGDLGWYCARTAVFFLGNDRTSVIRRVACFGNVTKDGWISDACGIVEFEGGEKLNFDCSFSTVLRQRTEAAGSKGTVQINDFVIPNDQFDNPGVAKRQIVETEFVTDIGIWSESSPLGGGFPSPSKISSTTVNEGDYSVQPVRMLREFARMILEKDVAASNNWTQMSVNTQRIVDALYKDFMAREKAE